MDKKQWIEDMGWYSPIAVKLGKDRARFRIIIEPWMFYKLTLNTPFHVVKQEKTEN